MIENNTLIEQHIGIYDLAYEPEYCQHIIDEFTRLSSMGACQERHEYDPCHVLEKSDSCFEASFDNTVEATNHTLAPYTDRDGTEHLPREYFWQKLQQCLNIYTARYPDLGSKRIKTTTMKIQRTLPGQGYHVWHSEYDPSICNHNRVLVFTLYLNTLGQEDGGETEYLYQRARVRAKQGTVVIWPAGFTHTHRGNTVLGQDAKYIVTGWFHYEF